MTDIHESQVQNTEISKPVRKKKPIVHKAEADVPFEAAMARLEEIIATLEGRGDTVSLDESLRLYEEGVTLVRRCTGELNSAEQRVQILQRTADGEIKPRDFAANEV